MKLKRQLFSLGHYIITRHNTKIIQIKLITKQHLIVTARIHVHTQLNRIDVGDIKIIFIPYGTQSTFTNYLVFWYWI